MEMRRRASADYRQRKRELNNLQKTKKYTECVNCGESLNGRHCNTRYCSLCVVEKRSASNKKYRESSTGSAKIKKWANSNKEKRSAYNKKYNESEKGKKTTMEYRSSESFKERRLKRQREYKARPDIAEKSREYARKLWQQKAQLKRIIDTQEALADAT